MKTSTISGSSCTCTMASGSSSETDQETPEPCWKRKEFDDDDQPALETRSKKEETSCHESGSDVLLDHSSAAVSSLIKENIKTRGGADRDKMSTEDTGRERLKRHRVEVAGQVWIPEIWGQEELLKDWIDCSAFDASVLNASIMSARAALVEEGRWAHATRLRI